MVLTISFPVLVVAMVAISLIDPDWHTGGERPRLKKQTDAERDLQGRRLEVAISIKTPGLQCPANQTLGDLGVVSMEGAFPTTR